MTVLNKKQQWALAWLKARLPNRATANFVPLHCDVCDKVLGQVSESDLNGSYFLCSDCLEHYNR